MKLIYQSPKSKLFSSPIDEKDARRRAILEASGWRIVERVDEEGESVDVITLATLSDQDRAIMESLERGEIPDELVVDADEAPEVVYVEAPVNLAAVLGLSEAQEAALVEAGYDSLETIEAAGNEDLLAVPGIGEKALARIREAFDE